MHRVLCGFRRTLALGLPFRLQPNHDPLAPFPPETSRRERARHERRRRQQRCLLGTGTGSAFARSREWIIAERKMERRRAGFERRSCESSL